MISYGSNNFLIIIDKSKNIDGIVRTEDGYEVVSSDVEAWGYILVTIPDE
jgi:hypothetical protein